MQDLFDYRTIALIFVVKSSIQALGLVYVWYVDRKYPPARKWAIGSLLFAIGILSTVALPDTTSPAIILARNIIVFAGFAAFGVGISEACGAVPPWRFFIGLISVALIGQWWFSAVQPSLSWRIVIFSVMLAFGELVVAAKAFRAPADPLRGTRRVIGILLTLQAMTALSAAAFQPHSVNIMEASTARTVFILVSVAVSFLLVLVLTILTGQRTNALLSAVLENLDQGVAMFDDDRRLVICNDRYGVLYGIGPSALKPGASLASVVARRVANGMFAGPNSQRYFEEQTTPPVEATTVLHHLNDGRAIVVSRRPMAFGGWLTTHSDVSAIRRIEEQVAYLAHHDALTGLANRQLFNDKLREARGRLGTGDEGFAILLIDLDRFKAINDTLGHPSGDALLAAVAQRLRSCVSEADVVARLGGDEFAIIQMTGVGRDMTHALAERILREVGAAYHLNGQKVMVGSSIGIAKAPENGNDVDQLMRNADLALYRSKAEGRNCYRFYDRDMDANIRARHSLELALRRSITSEDFFLEYQPVIDVRRKSVCAAEALVRWRHPVGTIVEPGKFIGIAEDTGLIGPLGEWILRRAATDAQAWPDEVRVSVNLSAVQLQNGAICDFIEDMLRETGLAPTRLELEVTESLFLHNSEMALAILHRLKKLGVTIALDDFGTGYSSLNYLTKFPFDRIKIDKSFIVDLASRTESSAIVAAIIGVASSLSMATTAEGVETADQYELLRIAGCHEMQGYLFGRPRPVADFTASLKKLSGRSARPDETPANVPLRRA